MTDARDIIAQEFRQAHRDTCYPDASDDECEIAASVIVASLTASGFRILGPDQIDGPTVEKCAATCEEPHTLSDGTAIVLPSGRAYATAIRALKEKRT